MNKSELTTYKNAHAKENYRHFHLKVPNHMTEVIEMLESQTNKNGYIIDLIEKDIDEKRVLLDIVGAPRRGNGKMRNERFLQNYTASLFRMALSGKGDFQDEQRTKDWWRKTFGEAIDDLLAGGVINGKGMKNNVSYWEEQIRLLDEFEPR